MCTHCTRLLVLCTWGHKAHSFPSLMSTWAWKSCATATASMQSHHEVFIICNVHLGCKAAQVQDARGVHLLPGPRVALLPMSYEGMPCNQPTCLKTLEASKKYIMMLVDGMLGSILL